MYYNNQILFRSSADMNLIADIAKAINGEYSAIFFAMNSWRNLLLIKKQEIKFLKFETMKSSITKPSHKSLCP